MYTLIRLEATDRNQELSWQAKKKPTACARMVKLEENIGTNSNTGKIK